jgi:predicted TIM-barrel fold metal-dependent hydrolase
VGESDDKGWIDAHVHVWTPDVKKYPLASSYKVADMKPASFTPKELWDHAEPEGVRRVVLIQMSFYGFDNGYMCKRFAITLAGFAGVAVIDERQTSRRDEAAEEAWRERLSHSPGGRPVETWLDGLAWPRCGVRREENLAMRHLTRELAAVCR